MLYVQCLVVHKEIKSRCTHAYVHNIQTRPSTFTLIQLLSHISKVKIKANKAARLKPVSRLEAEQQNVYEAKIHLIQGERTALRRSVRLTFHARSTHGEAVVEKYSSNIRHL